MRRVDPHPAVAGEDDVIVAEPVLAAAELGQGSSNVGRQGTARSLPDNAIARVSRWEQRCDRADRAGRCSPVVERRVTAGSLVLMPLPTGVGGLPLLGCGSDRAR